MILINIICHYNTNDIKILSNIIKLINGRYLNEEPIREHFMITSKQYVRYKHR